MKNLFYKVLSWFGGTEYYRLGGMTRSSHWSNVRKSFIKKYPHCALCGSDKDCDVHHCIPFSQNPSLELEENNLITLCTPHHLLCGHLMLWKSWNFEVRKDASDWKLKIMNRP